MRYMVCVTSLVALFFALMPDDPVRNRQPKVSEVAEILHRMDFLFCKGSLILLLAVGVAAFPTTAQQQPRETSSNPPTSFSAEDDKFPDAMPLPG